MTFKMLQVVFTFQEVSTNMIPIYFNIFTEEKKKSLQFLITCGVF